MSIMRRCEKCGALVSPGHESVCQCGARLRPLKSGAMVVNIFGGPGAGKSTTAAGVFALLKLHGVNCELVTEYAKELVWGDDSVTLRDQELVFAEQSSRIRRLIDKVDVIVTDSPVLMSLIYGKNVSDDFTKSVYWEHIGISRVNYFINRVKAFNQAGRLHSLEKSMKIDSMIHQLLSAMDEPYRVIDGDWSAPTLIAADILEVLGYGEMLCGVFGIDRGERTVN